MSALVHAQNIDFQYPESDFKLRVAGFKIAPGETVALTGTSGSGKTTFAQILTGILVPQSGTVTFAGKTLSSATDAARRSFRTREVGFLFQDGGLIGYLSGLDNILLPYYITPALKLTPEIVSRAHELAATLDLTSRLSAKPDSLSGGERQRVSLARALLTQPALVVADEPTSGLDSNTAEKALDLLLDAAATHGAALLTITHDPAAAALHSRTADLADIAAAP